jgi:hypothetical protein
MSPERGARLPPAAAGGAYCVHFSKRKSASTSHEPVPPVAAGHDRWPQILPGDTAGSAVIGLPLYAYVRLQFCDEYMAWFTVLVIEAESGEPPEVVTAPWLAGDVMVIDPPPAPTCVATKLTEKPLPTAWTAQLTVKEPTLLIDTLGEGVGVPTVLSPTSYNGADMALPGQLAPVGAVTRA